ncbi:MAG TPA: hypothetical protein VGI80_03635, partial [Pyrinomonadaceae bacterium]
MPATRDTRFLKPVHIAVVVASAVFVYLLVFKFPGTPIYTENDSLIFLSDAQRMAAGEVIYGDFFQFTFPGVQVMYRMLFAVAGERFWLLPFVIVCIAAASAYLTMAVAKRVGTGAVVVAPAIIFIFFGFRYYGLEGTHRMISPIIILILIWVLLAKRASLPWVAIAGVLCSVTSFFTQQRGIAAVAGVVAWFLLDKLATRSRWKPTLARIATLIVSFAVVLPCLCAYFIITAGAETFWYSTVVFPSLYYGAADQNSGYILLSDLSTASAATSVQGFVAALAAALYGVIIPLVAVGCSFFVLWRSTQDWWKWNGRALIALVWIFLVLFTFGPSPIRLYEISALPLILIFSVLPQRAISGGRGKVVAAAACGLLIILALGQIWRTQFFW